MLYYYRLHFFIFIFQFISQTHRCTYGRRFQMYGCGRLDPGTAVEQTWVKYQNVPSVWWEDRIDWWGSVCEAVAIRLPSGRDPDARRESPAGRRKPQTRPCVAKRVKRAGLILIDLDSVTSSSNNTHIHIPLSFLSLSLSLSLLLLRINSHRETDARCGEPWCVVKLDVWGCVGMCAGGVLWPSCSVRFLLPIDRQLIIGWDLDRILWSMWVISPKHNSAFGYAPNGVVRQKHRSPFDTGLSNLVEDTTCRINHSPKKREHRRWSSGTGRRSTTSKVILSVSYHQSSGGGKMPFWFKQICFTAFERRNNSTPLLFSNNKVLCVCVVFTLKNHPGLHQVYLHTSTLFHQTRPIPVVTG